MNNYKPTYLPQISAPFNIVLDELKRENINYKKIILNPKNIKPSQSVIFLDKIEPKFDGYIWLSNDFKILDGHHRYGHCLSYNKPIKSIIIDLPFMDSVRILNKIQDIISFNDKNNINLFNVDVSNKRKLIGYRNKPINNDSESGNFFMLHPCSGYDKYEIEFDNLLDTDDLNIIFKTLNPLYELAEFWFKGVDLDFISNKHNIKKDILLNRLVHDTAKKFGFDGIKYGDIILQTIK